MSIDPIQLTQDLVRCESVTPEDDGAQQVLIDAVLPMGFTVEKLPFAEVENVFARLGTDGPHFCYAGHTDVVPPGDLAAWTHPPFAAEIHDGILYGRGTSDMKGGNACFVAAVSRFLEKHGAPDGSISLLITGDEEGPAVNGTVKVLEWMAAQGQIPDHCLVGESSNSTQHGEEIKVGRRGSLNGEIIVRGKQGHVAYQHLADNPVPKLAALVSVLSSYEFDQGNDHFLPTNLEVTTFDVGNPTANVIPATAKAAFNVRFNDIWTAKTLAEKITALLDETGIDYDISYASNAESFITQPGAFTDLVAGAVQDVCGRKPALTTKGGTSDARFISRYCPVVEYGVTNETIHQVDENATIADLEMLTDIYLRVLEQYFGKN